MSNFEQTNGRKGKYTSSDSSLLNIKVVRKSHRTACHVEFDPKPSPHLLAMTITIVSIYILLSVLKTIHAYVILMSSSKQPCKVDKY